ncbi:DoxX family membrane protein [Mycobacterium sp. KBS0706]|uniref:FAD-dependent oxidoreductase n=1 Tax=Mycobacterium sp. KBS0706 TaxID=2578109 RepID=UPI00110FF42B|nr:FAD-dependent oxidoreductase [Mycobacterium sp. KBS0706]TSD83675.1 DoxX family membrane protein [Mycobacterium sp. KBS0706]
MTSLSITAPRRSRAMAHFGRTLALWRDAIRIGEIGAAPVLDLLIRLWLAQSFWVSGIVKVSDWNAALYLAAHEYPVSWMNPVLAAWLGVTIELVGPLLLALGLATRFAAIPMLILALVVQYAYLPLESNLHQAVLFGWYAVMGAGPISLDRRIARGIGDTAVPFARPIASSLATITRFAGPPYLLFLRYWIAAVFFASGLVKISDFDSTIFLFQAEYSVPILSPVLAAYLSTAAELGCSVLIVLGLATRPAALALIGLTLVIELTYQHHVDHLYWMALLGLIVLRGPGLLSLDALVRHWLQRRFPSPADLPFSAFAAQPHVVVVGAGFGGVAATRALRHAPCRLTLIDRHNYHLFQPLLYQVATAGLSPADIATPIRGMFRDQSNARILLGRVTGVDAANQAVLIGEQAVPYDYLVLATGARHAYFGHDEWEPTAPGLKKIEDATDIRRRLLLAFERAEGASDAAERLALMTFVVVGGGPTGVELAGAIAELARHGMKREFRTIEPALARVLLVQSGPRVLPTFPEALSAAAARSLEGLGVELLLNNAVEAIDETGVVVGGRRIAARTVFWAAGVMASPAAKWLGAECDRAGRIKVGPDLSVPGLPNVFAIGDTAWSEGWNGKPVPGLAPAAKQAGAYVARLIRSQLEGRPAPAAFRYRHLGSLATIGRRSAVADFGWLRLSGPIAWWLWGAVHIAFLAGMRNRIVVALDWFWAYLTFRRSTRLITGEERG